MIAYTIFSSGDYHYYNDCNMEETDLHSSIISHIPKFLVACQPQVEFILTN